MSDLKVNFMGFGSFDDGRKKPVLEDIINAVGEMSCEVHRKSAKLSTTGSTPENPDVEVSACCAEFENIVKARIDKIKARR